MYFLTNQLDQSDLFDRYIQSSYITLIRMANGFQSNKTFSQIKHKKLTINKDDQCSLVKRDILCLLHTYFLPPTYNLTTYLPTHQPTHLLKCNTYLPTYLPIHLLTYIYYIPIYPYTHLPSYLPTHLNVLPTYLSTHL